MTQYEIKLSEPWFTAVKHGYKTLEGRLNDEKRQHINCGDFIVIKSTTDNERLIATVKRKHIYKTFREGLVDLGHEDAIPFASLEEAVKVYEEIPGYKEGEGKYGVVFFALDITYKE